jgi:membrane protease subunit HflK
MDKMKIKLGRFHQFLGIPSIAGLINIFNLNDSRWGRGEEKNSDSPKSDPPESESGIKNPESSPTPSKQPQSQSGPPDLEELWRDFNQRLKGVFGMGKGNNGVRSFGGPPDSGMKKGGIAIFFGVVFFIWLASGFFLVQEGQQAVITQFGKYNATVSAGFNWRLPYPIQRHEMVFVTQIRSIDVGRDVILKATGLKESAMLTEDENIVDIKFSVQYRLNDARAFLFESKDPTESVVKAAETAVREVIGRMKMDAILSEGGDKVAPQVRTLMQSILDKYKVGIEVVGINLQQGGVRPPDQVQASFDDVLKAGQERERLKNEAQAYANDVVPRAVGAASRLKEEADAYKARVVAQAQGDSQRFQSIYTEYKKAPQVTRDRMYLDAMQQIYSNVTKVIVESKQGSSLLYLPLEKLLQGAGNAIVPTDAAVHAAPVSTLPATTPPTTPSFPTDPRSRDAARTRDRDAR